MFRSCSAWVLSVGESWLNLLPFSNWLTESKYISLAFLFGVSGDSSCSCPPMMEEESGLLSVDKATFLFI